MRPSVPPLMSDDECPPVEIVVEIEGLVRFKATRWRAQAGEAERLDDSAVEEPAGAVCHIEAPPPRLRVFDSVSGQRCSRS